MPFDTVSTWTITSKNQLWKENIPRKQYPQKWLNWHFCHSVARSCPTLCNLMDCSTPGFPVLRHLPELAQTHVHWVGDAIQLIAYGEQCWICDLRRFNFGTRDQVWSLKSFCIAEFYWRKKGTEKASDIDIRRGTESAPSASFNKLFYACY